jgi:parallel beta-helix repeat protein
MRRERRPFTEGYRKMKLKAVSRIMLTLLLIGILTLAFDIQPVEASGTIYIRADGSVDPPTANITTVDNVTYTFTDNINDSIVIERDNIVVDGDDYTVQGTGSGTGIDLSSRSNVTIKNIEIKTFGYGIWLNMSSKITISKSNITNNGPVFDSIAAGIYLKDSSDSTISGNNITNNTGVGILFWASSNNSVIGNIFSNNGLYVLDSFQNVVESNLVNDKPLVYLEEVSNYTVANAGQVILVNCDNILVENLDLSNTTICGVELWRTNNTNIVNNTMTNNGDGITLFEYSSNNNIHGNNITNNVCGVNLGGASNNSISGNNITNNWTGISLNFSLNNTITNNVITNTNGFYPYPHGLDFHSSSNNTICKNTIAKHELGIYFDYSSDNIFYYNNFVNNTNQVYVLHESINCWNYILKGNFWSNYVGVDLDHDGIGDTMHYIGSGNVDNYPLMGMFSDFKATLEYNVQTVCNSSISDFQFNGSAICFKVTGEDGTIGFCRICIPRALMNETYQVFVNGTEVQCNLLPCSNTTHSYLYFTYNLSTQKVIIIPEFPSFLILPIIMTATLLAVILYRRKRTM